MSFGVNVNKVIEIIDKDIEEQKRRMSRNFEYNKSITWRITGMEYVKKEIIDSYNRGDLR